MDTDANAHVNLYADADAYRYAITGAGATDVHPLAGAIYSYPMAEANQATNEPADRVAHRLAHRRAAGVADRDTLATAGMADRMAHCVAHRLAHRVADRVPYRMADAVGAARADHAETAAARPVTE